MDKPERDLIHQIAERAVQLAASHGNPRARAVDISMALTFVHLETPLRLKELYEASDAQFAHDVFGIWKHIDKSTGKLDTVAFRPKFLAHIKTSSAEERADMLAVVERAEKTANK